MPPQAIPNAGRWPRPCLHEWLIGAVGLELVFAYYWLLDDAFVYFRYVDNLVFLDLGLVYNAGEYVEGFTSPLWTLLLVAFRCTQLVYPLIVLVMAALCYAFTWYALVFLNRALSPAGSTVNLPLAFLLMNYPVLCYFSSGLETPLLQLMAVVFACAAVRPGSRALQATVALAPLVRPELLLPLAMLAGWCAWHERRVPWCLLGIGLLVNGGWLLFRIWYYADFFPNTYYLKNETNIARGLVYLADALHPYHYLGISATLYALAVAAAARQAAGANRARLVLLALAVPVTLYVIKVGGDARHYRYLAFPLILVACSWAGAVESWLLWMEKPLFTKLAPLIALGMAAWSLSCYPSQISGHPLREKTLVLLTDDKIADALGHRRNPRLAYENWAVDLGPPMLFRKHSPRAPIAYRGFRCDGMCVDAYRKYDQRVIHMFGLTDPILARVDTPSERPGHKNALFDLAVDLILIQQDAESIAPGYLRAAVDAGDAPTWIANNIEALELIEKKAFNKHCLLENFRLAWQPIPPLSLDDANGETGEPSPATP